MVEIIKSCVPNIKDPWKITGVDLDAILVAIRSASSGNEMEIETQCPACDETAKYGVNLAGLLNSIKAGDYSKELIIGDLSIKFRPLTFKEMTDASLSQFDLQRLFAAINAIEKIEEKTDKQKEMMKTIIDATMKVLSNTIEYVKTPTVFVAQNEFILDYLRNCDKATFELIKDYHAALKVQSEIQPLKIICMHCKHEYDQPFSINASDFFV